jgi:hypothetical protein
MPVFTGYPAYLLNMGFVETLRCHKKNKREIRRQEGVSLPPCPTPIKIFFGQGFPKVH